MAVYTDSIVLLTSDWDIGVSGWGTSNSLSLNNLRNIIIPEVVDVSNNVASPSDSDFYIVGTAGTGTFVGQDNNLAFYKTNAWFFLAPPPRTVKYNLATKQYLQWDGTTWNALNSQGNLIESVAVTGTVTLDLSVAGNFITDGATGACTLAFSNVPSNVLTEITYVFKQDATGSRTLAFPASVVWAGGTAPTITTTASREDEFKFSTRDGGVTWRGVVIGQDYS